MEIIQSRSRWPLLLVNESLVHHGEKSTDQISRIDLGHIHLENQREESLASENRITFLTANDQDVIPWKESTTTSIQQQSYNVNRNTNQIKMEEFIDLSRYCHTDKLDGLFIKDVDELNTPIFELRNPFDFGGQLRNTINNHTDLLQQQHQQQQQHIDHNYIINLKSEIENVNNNNDIIFNNRCANINLMENIKVEDSIDIVKNSLDISNNFNINDNKETVMWSHQQQQQPPNHQHIQQREEEQDIIDYMNPTTITMAYTILDDDDEKLMTVENFDDVLKIKQVQNASNVNNSLQTYDEYQNLTTYDTPDESTCSSSISNRSTNQKLKLNITAASSYVQDEEPSIKTSDVIDTINEIESTRGFNILQYINDEELQLVAETADSIATTSTAGDADDTFNTTFSSEDFQRNASTSKRATRKRYEEESDEEYLPPSEKRVKRSRNCKDLSMHDVEQSMTKSKRGRPPKRNVSISSDDYYGDTPEARYRELRDKNNEASRKSRLKRKIKENDLETEGDQLDERNRILRVQVEELEKTVTRFRNNLMTLLLNKKT